MTDQLAITFFETYLRSLASLIKIGETSGKIRNLVRTKENLSVPSFRPSACRPANVWPLYMNTTFRHLFSFSLTSYILALSLTSYFPIVSNRTLSKTIRVRVRENAFGKKRVRRSEGNQRNEENAQRRIRFFTPPTLRNDQFSLVLFFFCLETYSCFILTKAWQLS